MGEILFKVILFIGMATFSIIFIKIGIKFKNKAKIKEKCCTLKTTGQVVEVIKELRHGRYENGRQSKYYLYFPVVRYNVNGFEFTKKIEYGTSFQMYAIGNYIDVYVNPNDFDDIYIKEELGAKGIANCLIVFGILMLVFSFIFIGALILSDVLVLILESKFSAL